MANFWTATDDTVAKIIEKSRELNLEKHRYLIDSLIDYYQDTDNGYGREEFNRIERQRWPDLPEEELLMPEILLGQERIHKEGVDKGIILGRKEGIALGQKKGIALGQKKGIALGQKKGIALGQKKGIAFGQEKIILKMLKSGKMTDSMICEVAEISKEELTQIKKKLK